MDAPHPPGCPSGSVDLNDAESVRRSGTYVQRTYWGATNDQRLAHRFLRPPGTRRPSYETMPAGTCSTQPASPRQQPSCSGCSPPWLLPPALPPAAASSSTASPIDVAHPLCPRFRAPVSPALHAQPRRQADGRALDHTPALRSAPQRAHHAPLPPGTLPRHRAHPPALAPRPCAGSPAVPAPAGKVKNNSVRTLPMHATGE